MLSVLPNDSHCEIFILSNSKSVADRYLSSDLFPSCLATKMLYAFLVLSVHASSSTLVTLSDLIILTVISSSR